MRVITEANAQTIIEVIQAQIATLEKLPRNNLRVQNKIRLMQIALMEIQTNKVNKTQLKAKS